MPRRSRARQVALQALFQLDVQPELDEGAVCAFVRRRCGRADLAEFALSLVEGSRRHADAIDALLTDAAENWTLKRMAAVDRNVLRLGAYELLYHPGTPPKVAIDEAIELAKRFGSNDSSAFVNGILDRLLAGRPASGEADPAAG